MSKLDEAVEKASASQSGNQQAPEAAAARASQSESQEGAGREEGKEAGQEGATPDLTIENLEDVRKYAPQLEPMAKSLESDYRKKTEEIAKIRNKATAYEELLQDPRFQDYYNRAYGYGSKDSGSNQQETEKAKGPLDDIDVEDEMMDDNTKRMVQVARQQQQEISQLKSTIAQQKNEVMLDKLEEVYPDIREKLPTLIPLINQKGYSLKAAYLEKYGDEYYQRKLEREREQLSSRQQDEAAAQEAGSEPPNVGSGGGEEKPPAEKKNKSIGAAVEQAFEEISTR